jgi:hypothetical protein
VFYADFVYPEIPYWAGGGKPRPIAMWVEEKSLLLTAKWGCRFDGDLLYCDGLFLVYSSSEIFIMARKDDAFAATMVLRRDTVKAVTDRNNPWLSEVPPIPPQRE